MTAISGFVVAYNRAALLGTCLRSLRFVDELIVIDKSSTDGSPRIARRYADRVITVPWSPTVEETRGFALEQCRHDRIVFLDDDEMLSPEAIAYLHALREDDAPDAVALPLRHWILGAFDADAYYWPEHHLRFFRKGAVTFGPLVHGGIDVHTDRVVQVPAELADLDRAPVAHGRHAVDRADQPLHLTSPACGRHAGRLRHDRLRPSSHRPLAGAAAATATAMTIRRRWRCCARSTTWSTA